MRQRTREQQLLQPHVHVGAHRRVQCRRQLLPPLCESRIIRGQGNRRLPGLQPPLAERLQGAGQQVLDQLCASYRSSLLDFSIVLLRANSQKWRHQQHKQHNAVSSQDLHIFVVIDIKAVDLQQLLRYMVPLLYNMLQR